MKRFIASFLFIFSVVLSGFAQAKKELVIKVTLDKKNYSSLDQNSRSFISSAYMQFLQDMTMLPQISVRTSDTDNELREIQKQSQIDAATGLGSEDAAYAADRGSRADLVLNLALNNAGNGNYQVVCTISEIETMRLISTETTERLPIAKVTEDLAVDEFVYKVLSDLAKRSYIEPLSVDITNQLLHRDNSEESFRKYVDEYTRQRQEAERELANLRKDAKSEEERMELEAQELALQLKIEMAEKNRQIAEENLRRQQNENTKAQKRQQEIDQMQNAQREQFLQDIQAIEAARTAIRKETLTSLPLKKRIELIESARGNLRRLEGQLAESVSQSNAYYDEKMNAEIDEVYAEPWRKADLSNGEPTQRALNFRNQKISKIRDNYAAQKKTAENQLKTAAKPTIDGYKSQVQENISDMEKTTYVFRSIDVTDDFLTLEVSEFDGARMVWDVYSDFNMSTIQKIDMRKVVLPKTSLSYEAMVGSKADLNTDEGYQKYQDTVDTADLYFRTSVPYLYSQIAIKVRYNSTMDIYEVNPLSFQIFKTQNNKKPIITYTEKNFEAARKVQAESVSAAAYTYEYQKSESKAYDDRTSQNTISTYQKKSKSFNLQQEAREGLFMDVSRMKGAFFDGVDISLSILGGGKNVFAGLDTDFLSASISSDYTVKSNDTFYLWSLDFVLGYSLTLGILKPYVAAGIGGYTAGKEDIFDSDVYGLQLEGIAGIDVEFLDIITLGFVYKIKYMYGSGFIDNIGGSIGLIW